MKYLLDVNALIACEHLGSSHHAPFHTWATKVGMNHLLTCAHSELGFIHVSMQAFGYSLENAQVALAEIKKLLGGFVAEAPSPLLPVWAKTAAKTSDAYLKQVADQNGLHLATFDRGIPGAPAISP